MQLPTTDVIEGDVRDHVDLKKQEIPCLEADGVCG